MSFASNNPNALLADKGWRRKNSLWRWWVFLGFGLLGCVGFLIIAVRVQNKKFWTAAAVASIGSAACWLAMAVSEGDSATSEVASKAGDTTSDGGWGAGVTMAIWVAQVVYALMISRDYLRWKADSNNEWYNQPVGNRGANQFSSAPPPVQSTAPPAAPFPGVDTSAYYANTPPPPPVAQTPPAAAGPTPAPTAGHSPRHSPIDINSASAGEIAMALGVDDTVVRRVIDARIQGGGFSSMDDLVRRAGLQPHEMVRFRDKVRFGPVSTVSPTASSAPPPGQPKHPTEPGAGRILDY